MYHALHIKQWEIPSDKLWENKEVGDMWDHKFQVEDLWFF